MIARLIAKLRHRRFPHANPLSWAETTRRLNERAQARAANKARSLKQRRTMRAQAVERDALQNEWVSL